jgi:cysteinyl-tRNA synthetase
MDALRDDLNTPMALGAVFSALKAHPPEELTPEQAADCLACLDRVLWALGLDVTTPLAPADAAPAAVAALAERRWQAKKAKDFAAADALRGEIAAAGWSMLDGKDGYRLEVRKP